MFAWLARHQGAFVALAAIGGTAVALFEIHQHAARLLAASPTPAPPALPPASP